MIQGYLSPLAHTFPFLPLLTQDACSSVVYWAQGLGLQDLSLQGFHQVVGGQHTTTTALNFWMLRADSNEIFEATAELAQLPPPPPRRIVSPRARAAATASASLRIAA